MNETRTPLVVAVSGSRSIDSWEFVESKLDQGLSRIRELFGIEDIKIISGGARGVDQLTEFYAYKRKIPFQEYPADWDLHGRSAGFKRNIELARDADHIIALWDEHSKGTKHMIKTAAAQFKRPVIVYFWRNS